MKSFNVSGNYLRRFKRHMDQFVEEGIISKDQSILMSDRLEKRNVRFITVVTVIGALLTGLGILLYIGSNWDHLGQLARLLLIVGGMLAFYFSGLRLEKKYYYTGKSLIYIAVLIYGGGLFLIDQTFNLDMRVDHIFLLWTLGILPLAFAHKDFFILLLAQVLNMIFIFGSIVEESYNIMTTHLLMALLMGGLWYGFVVLNQAIKSRISTFLSNLIILGILEFALIWFDFEPIFYVGLGLLVGLILYYRPLIPQHKAMSKLAGILLIGAFGLALTFENLWQELDYIKDGTGFAVVFAIVLAVFLFWLTREGHVSSLCFICILIFRYYVDTLYDFLPRSMFFIFGGLLLLAFGVYLERLTRKKGGGLNV